MELRKKDSNSKFPKVVFMIIIFQFSERYSYHAYRGLLPLYLVDVLNYTEDEATVFYHTLNLFLFSSSVIGGILADSLFGKFKSIIIFSIIFVTGLTLLSFTSAPPLNLPLREFTLLGVVLASFGNGALMACVIAFGGDQFVLPRQEKQLSLLFVFLCISNNSAMMSTGFITPVVRKDLTCFGRLTCYPLAFILPAILLTLTSVLILTTKRFYKIEKPKDNVIVNVTKCLCHAIYRKIASKEKYEHLLDYASDKYDPKLIEDIKSVSRVLILFLPLPIFRALYSLPTTLWIFQASRMNGEVGGYVMKPDQLELLNSMCIIVLVPIFHSYVYPFLAKFCAINTPLRRITLGCCLTALAFYVSGVVELNLEPTYPKVPVEGFAQLRIYNTLDCDVPMTISEQSLTLKSLDMYQNINIVANGEKILKYEADFSHCNTNKFKEKVAGTLSVMENTAISYAITPEGINYRFIDRVDKSNSRNPLVRALVHVSDDFTSKTNTLNLINDGTILETITIPEEFSTSNFKEILHKTYDIYLNDLLLQSNIPFKNGGVYTILGHISNSSISTRTITVTQPNSMHMLWALPQQIIMCIAEIMVDVLVVEFLYSQAPESMKAFMQSFWLFLGFFGNLLVIVVTEAHFFDRKVFELFLYAILMTLATIVFSILSTFYKYNNPTNTRTLEKITE